MRKKWGHSLPAGGPGSSNACSNSASCRSRKNTNAYVSSFLLSKKNAILCPVSVLSRSADLCAPPRRKVAAGLPGRLSLRAMPTLDGIPLSPHARGRQSPTRALAPRMPDDRQGIRRHPCVLHLVLASQSDGTCKKKVFDRMFSLGVRGSGTDTAPLGARVAAVAGMASATLPRRHFLYCSLRPENPVPPRGQRHHHRHHRDTMS